MSYFFKFCSPSQNTSRCTPSRLGLCMHYSPLLLAVPRFGLTTDHLNHDEYLTLLFQSSKDIFSETLLISQIQHPFAKTLKSYSPQLYAIRLFNLSPSPAPRETLPICDKFLDSFEVPTYLVQHQIRVHATGCHRSIGESNLLPYPHLQYRRMNISHVFLTHCLQIALIIWRRL